MDYLATLLRHPHEDVRAALLTGAVEEQGAQPVLDERAREAYRRQVAELRREIDEADAYADIERAAARRAEFDALLEELTRVVRPGGRSRAFTGADERARTSVQKALRRADRGHRRERAQARRRAGAFRPDRFGVPVRAGGPARVLARPLRGRSPRDGEAGPAVNRLRVAMATRTLLRFVTWRR